MNRSTVRRIIATTATAWMLAAGAQAQPPSNANWPFPRDGWTTTQESPLNAQYGMVAQGISRLFEPRPLP